MKRLDRRQFLIASALAAGGALMTSRLAFASANTTSRFVFIILRGALDGLTAVPPYGDPDYARLRGDIAIPAPGAANGAIKLDNVFGLHPNLRFLGDCYAARQLVAFHAVASPYRERSHFDGQDVLENGFVRPHASQTGWLNRALAAVPSDRASSRKELGVALGQNVPLVMRGPASVASWSPSKLAALDEDTLDRITDLYARDPVLSKRLADALAANAIASEARTDTADAEVPMTPQMSNRQGGAAPPAADGVSGVAQPEAQEMAGATSARAGDASSGSPSQLLAKREQGKAAAGARYTEVIRATANFLRRDDGPQIAVFDATGWDTHANEGGAQGQLAARLAALDAGLRTLQDQLGDTWKNTAVLIATEFGRTAAINGTRGTDHGTGAAAFLLGGAVQGGRVISDWPGLSSSALYEGRDLKPTLDTRSIMKGVLADHLRVATRTLESDVFPDSNKAKALNDLFRA
jgi:uncharacterized protein (DUF1501 family)